MGLKTENQLFYMYSIRGSRPTNLKTAGTNPGRFRVDADYTK